MIPKLFQNYTSRGNLLAPKKIAKLPICYQTSQCGHKSDQSQHLTKTRSNFRKNTVMSFPSSKETYYKSSPSDSSGSKAVWSNSGIKKFKSTSGAIHTSGPTCGQFRRSTTAPKGATMFKEVGPPSFIKIIDSSAKKQSLRLWKLAKEKVQPWKHLEFGTIIGIGFGTFNILVILESAPYNWFRVGIGPKSTMLLFRTRPVCIL